MAQLGRSIARALALNEDLVEAIALAHDLGHTPFGHAGQDALHECMRAHGGFEHNLQSLRVVDTLEARYAAFDGLNLSFETREGILKHCSRRNAQRLVDTEPGGPAQRFLDGGQPSLEAQLVDLADELAYSAHDVDDGLRAGLIDWAQVSELQLTGRWQRQVLAEHPQLQAVAGRRLLAETLRRMLSDQVADVIRSTTAALDLHRPSNNDELRRLPVLAQLGPQLRAETDELKRFLFQKLYRHPQVVRTTDLARTVVTQLFQAYLNDPGEMPPDHARATALPRAVADYIAGMTDRFAQREHQRLTGQRLFAAVP